MSSTTDLIESYLAGVQTLRQAVAGLSKEQARARPVPGKWSTLEVVCHIADFEPVYADRMKRVIAEDKPPLFSADQDRFAAQLMYMDRDMDEEIAIIENTRRQMARILKGLPGQAFARTGLFFGSLASDPKAPLGEGRPRSLEELLRNITNHIPHHVEFIHDKRKALGLAV
jgi:hypothetical protein